MTFVLPADFDRTTEQRYRLYRRRADAVRADCVASSPDPGGAGDALVRLAMEGEIVETDQVGVLDTCDPETGELTETGTWLVNPYPRRRA